MWTAARFSPARYLTDASDEVATLPPLNGSIVWTSLFLAVPGRNSISAATPTAIPTPSVTRRTRRRSAASTRATPMAIREARAKLKYRPRSEAPNNDHARIRMLRFRRPEGEVEGEHGHGNQLPAEPIGAQRAGASDQAALVALHRREAEVDARVGVGQLLKGGQCPKSSEREYRCPGGPPQPLDAVQEEEHQEHERHVLDEEHQPLQACGRVVEFAIDTIIASAMARTSANSVAGRRSRSSPTAWRTSKRPRGKRGARR